MAAVDEKIPEDEMTIYNPLDKRQYKAIKNFHLVEIQKDIFLKGKLVYNEPTMDEKRAYCNEEMEKLYKGAKRETNPDIYKVSATERYAENKDALIKTIKGRVLRKEI